MPARTPIVSKSMPLALRPDLARPRCTTATAATQRPAIARLTLSQMIAAY